MKLAGAAALQTRLLEGTFYPPRGGVRNPRTGFQAPPISESQLINLLNGTPLEGSLSTVKRILDFTESLASQRQIWRAEKQGLGRERLECGSASASPKRSVPWGRHKEGPGPRHYRGLGCAAGVCVCDNLGLFSSNGERAPSLGV